MSRALPSHPSSKEDYMSVNTEAENALDSAKENLNDAITNLSRIVCDRVYGSNDYKDEYLSKIKKAFFDLISVRDAIYDD